MFTSVCFQCVISLQYSLEEASTLIETLSQNWDRFRDHLEQVARLPSYRFHMREVYVFWKCFMWLYILLISKKPFSFSQIRWMSVFGWTRPIWPDCSSYVVSSTIVSIFHEYLCQNNISLSQKYPKRKVLVVLEFIRSLVVSAK